ncbi:MAG: biotin/lipoyl-binding protein [Candidatus Omnitrophica bacterium]|nr:biotin/lipoyl-binding protein [Candidatus Omnitrophota bacterium]
MVEVTLTNLPKGVGEATIQAWYFEEGDAIVQGDEIVELVTEEGAVTLTAPVSGILAEVYYDEGETVEQGEVLCLIETEDEDDEEDEDEEE